LLQRPDLDCSSVNKRLSWSQQGSLRMPETDPGGGGGGGGIGIGIGIGGGGGWSSSGGGQAFAGGVVIVGGPDNGDDQHSSPAASAAAAAGGNHSLSLSISTEFDPGWDNAGREPRLGGFIKIGGGGKSAPPSPLTTAARLFSSSPVQVSPGSGGGGGRQCATPPVPPRNHQHHHVSSTYISQDRHTLIVTTPDSDRIPVKDCVNGGGGTLVRTLRRPKSDTAASVIAVKPEIKINLAEPREPAAVPPPILAATVSVVPPVSISISGQDGGGVKLGGNGGGVRGLGGGGAVKHSGGGGSPSVVPQGHGAEKLRLREVLLTESS
jgi:hypothetical protein